MQITRIHLVLSFANSSALVKKFYSHSPPSTFSLTMANLLYIQNPLGTFIVNC